MNHRLALGTVQLGIPYGVANQFGQISRDEAPVILECAWGAGVDTLDTAINYGDSEQCLGEIGVGQWQIISKLPALPDSCANIKDWAYVSVLGSLKRLRIKRLRGLLLHHSEQLLGPEGEKIYEALLWIKEQGLVEKIGVSIYDPETLDQLIPRFPLDVVQAPLNILDRRLLTSGWMTRLKQANTEVHVRSIFLQGLLLLETGKRSSKFNRWQLLWDEWHCWLTQEGLTPLLACLGFVFSYPEIDRVVVGVDSLKQLQELLSCIEAPAVAPPVKLMSKDIDLINPSHWSSL